MSDPVKDRIATRVAEVDAELIELSEQLHSDPELGWHEYRSSTAVADLLTTHGFHIEQPYLGLDTAFRAVYEPPAGEQTYTVGFLAEYDALPGLGHACGHNLIAAMATGAAIALSEIADTAGIAVEVIGTPAEEGGGGKIELLDRGAFADLDLALMAHPAPADIAEARPYAVAHWHVRYDGQAAHAAAYPQRGINANDAFLIAQHAIALLRQQLPDSARVHGIMTHAGEAPNAIPETTQGRWYIRADTTPQLLTLEDQIHKCFEAGAVATGARLTITPESKRYAEMRTDTEALQIYRQNAEAVGRSFDADPAATTMARASTDMGNVSQIVNAIHPYIGVGGEASNHQQAFATACTGPTANQTLRDGATSLAWTAYEVARSRHAIQHTGSTVKQTAETGPQTCGGAL